MLIDEVKEILADQLEISQEEIDTESNIYNDLGADSLDLVDISMTIEDQYSIEVSEEAVASFSTVEDIVSYIESNLD